MSPGARRGDCAVCRQKGIQVRPDSRTGETLVCVHDHDCFAAYTQLPEVVARRDRSAARSLPRPVPGQEG